jgi:hypothetical protein
LVDRPAETLGTAQQPRGVDAVTGGGDERGETAQRGVVVALQLAGDHGVGGDDAAVLVDDRRLTVFPALVEHALRGTLAVLDQPVTVEVGVPV